MCGLLSACGAIVYPAKAVTDKGEVYTGETKVSLAGGSFHLDSKSGETCHGTFDPFFTEQVIMMYMSCSDGKHGKLAATRDLPLGTPSGTGNGVMSDGTKFTFAYGQSRIQELDK